MGLTWQYVLRLPSLHRSFQPHTPQFPLPTYHPYSITHTTQHTVTTTHSPSQLHLLYTQNSLNTHHKLLVHIPQLFSIINQCNCMHGHTPHHKPLHLQANKSSTTNSTCTIVVDTWKALCTKLWLLVKIVKQLTVSIKALWHRSPALWSMGFAPSGTNPIQLETHGTTITLHSTPFNAHLNPQSPQTILLFTTHKYTQPFQNNE